MKSLVAGLQTMKYEMVSILEELKAILAVTEIEFFGAVENIGMQSSLSSEVNHVGFRK